MFQPKDTTAGRSNVHHDITIPSHTRVNATVAYDARVRSQITGFILSGLGLTSSDGTAPAVGDSCPAASDVAVVTDVTLTSSTGGLYVNYGGISVSLPNTPVI